MLLCALLTDVVCSLPFQAAVDGIKDVLAAQTHLVDQLAVVDLRRPRLVVP